MVAPRYVGRFAPSPSGALHQGSLVAAVASYLDARSRGGAWLVRIEDIDTGRTAPGAAEAILEALSAHGMRWDAAPVRQSERGALYARAFETLVRDGHVFACACTRREIADTGRPGADGAPVYPGTCRFGLGEGRLARSWRLRVTDQQISLIDRQAGAIEQNIATDVGDFILRRADGAWAYQLAVVVDDAAQEITDVVRGADLLLSTPRQLYLQRCLGLQQPHYLHVPLVTDARGVKLSKQNGAPPLELARPLEALHAAALHLGLGPFGARDLPDFWEQACARWRSRYPLSSAPCARQP